VGCKLSVNLSPFLHLNLQVRRYLFQAIPGNAHLLLGLLLLASAFSSRADQPLTHTGLDAGYYDMYDLDFAGAHQVFVHWIADHPEDPLGPASDAAAFLFSEFDRLGVLDIELFAEEDRFVNRKRPSSDPAIRRAFDDSASRADQLAAAALRRNPRDARALYAETLMAGMRSQYAAMIDKRDYAALKYCEQGSKLAHQTLAIDPSLYDANIAMGVENYMLSLKPGVLRLFLSLRGDQTSKEEGIRLMRLTSDRGHYLAPFARLMLAVAELKDNHPQQARDLLASLAREFPRNSLYTRQLLRIR
jgi:hypothetical protein